MAKESKPIHQLEMHESTRIDTNIKKFVVTRVPGGWIYGSIYGDSYSTIFVPFNSEGDERKEVRFSGSPTVR